MSELMLDVGQANELKMAFRRHSFTAEDVKRLSEGDFLAQVLLVIRGRAEVVIKRILTFLHAVQISAQPAITTSEEYFKEAGVVWMIDDFRAQFLGLEVPTTREIRLAIHRLEKDSLDKSILDELGNKAEISVSQFIEFLNAHHGSEEWFIFYLKGKNGDLWAIRALWHQGDGDWRVHVRSVANRGGWGAGYQVLSQV